LTRGSASPGAARPVRSTGFTGWPAAPERPPGVVTGAPVVGSSEVVLAQPAISAAAAIAVR
jgi:hypothetical protein